MKFFFKVLTLFVVTTIFLLMNLQWKLLHISSHQQENEIPTVNTPQITIPQLSEAPPIQHELIKFVHTPNICNGTPTILIVVHSSANNSKNRYIFRKTLGSLEHYDGLKTKLIFVTGTSKSKEVQSQFEDEVSAHGDILVIDMEDTYKKMSYKAIGWMKWMVSSLCSKIEHVIKIDDDTFLHMFAISKIYKTCNSEKPDPLCHKMGCILWKGFKPHRKGKYSLTEAEYRYHDFPPFCPGIAIFIPGPLVPRLLEASRHVQFLWLDDVYVTGLLMEYLNEEHYNFEHKIISTLLKMYWTIVTGENLVAHFSKDVTNGVYVHYWNIVKSKNSKT